MKWLRKWWCETFHRSGSRSWSSARPYEIKAICNQCGREWTYETTPEEGIGGIRKEFNL